VKQQQLNVFDEVLQRHRGDGSAVLKQGDCVVMDNCGFHHGHRIEPVFRDMLANCGVRLLFQPPYSPHFNTCEYCFNERKAYLRRHQMLAVNETKIAIAQAILNITANSSYAYISSTVATFYEQRFFTCKSYHKTQLRKILHDISGYNV